MLWGKPGRNTSGTFCSGSTSEVAPDHLRHRIWCKQIPVPLLCCQSRRIAGRRRGLPIIPEQRRGTGTSAGSLGVRGVLAFPSPEPTNPPPSRQETVPDTFSGPFSGPPLFWPFKKRTQLRRPRIENCSRWARFKTWSTRQQSAKMRESSDDGTSRTNRHPMVHQDRRRCWRVGGGWR